MDMHDFKVVQEIPCSGPSHIYKRVNVNALNTMPGKTSCL